MRGKGSRLPPMLLTLVSKATRLLLAACVSVWMAGGCLFGCSNNEVLAAEVSPDNSTAAVSDESCNRSRQHDCCTRPNAQKTKPRKAKAPLTARRLNVATDSSALTALPHSMKDCPLMTNATAVTSKSNGSLPDPGHASVAVLPAIKHTIEQAEFIPVRSDLPNRGPTYLRCCVFLI